MPAGSEYVESFAIAHEDRSLILTDDKLRPESKFAGTRFRDPMHDLVGTLIWQLNEMEDRHWKPLSDGASIRGAVLRQRLLCYGLMLAAVAYCLRRLDRIETVLDIVAGRQRSGVLSGLQFGQ